MFKHPCPPPRPQRMNEEDIADVIRVLDSQLAAEPEDNAESEEEVQEPANEADEPEGGGGGAVYHNLCTYNTHCPCCPELITSRHLTNEEILLHGCCNNDRCLAFPEDDDVDYLGPIFGSPHRPNGPHNERRKWVYQQFFGVSLQHDILPERSTTGRFNGRTVTRYQWSSCVLHRVRSMYPDYEYLGFRPN